MPVTQTMTFSATVPQTGESPSTFNANAISCWTDLKDNIVPDLNTAFGQMNTLETNVNTKEASASASATASANSATASANSATDSANSANASQASAVASENSRLGAEALFDMFDDRYLGAKASAPTVDNDGNALQSGVLYYNTTTNAMYVRDTTLNQWISLSFTPTDHGALSGLSDDDHTQYHNDARGDARYYVKADAQEKLVSGTNIKTVNGNSILGSGNLLVSPLSKTIFTSLTTHINPIGITDIDIQSVNIVANAGYVYYYPFILDESLDVDALSTYIRTAMASSILTIGLYDSHATTKLPNNRIAMSSSIDTSTTGLKDSIITPITLNANFLYYMALKGNDSGVQVTKCIPTVNLGVSSASVYATNLLRESIGSLPTTANASLTTTVQSHSIDLRLRKDT